MCRGCRLLLLQLGVLYRFVMADGTAGHSTKHSMMACNMPSDATDCRTGCATDSFGGTRGERQKRARRQQHVDDFHDRILRNRVQVNPMIPRSRLA